MEEQAGIHSSEAADRTRGRRYFQVACSKHTVHHNPILDGLDELTSTTFGRETPSARGAKSDYCGLSSLEMSAVYDRNHRRGRRQICHSKYAGGRTPSTPSLASEPLSVDSEEFHLGHRSHIHCENNPMAHHCWGEEIPEAGTQSNRTFREPTAEDPTPHVVEPMGGVTSHHLAKKKGSLGWGKRQFGPEASLAHAMRGIGDPGGEDVDDREHTKVGSHKGSWSFLGPKKGKAPTGTNFQSDDVFCDTVEEKERHSKKHFKDHMEEAVHATADIPIGVSTQIDLHTHGFLGKSKHNFGGMMQISCDPIAHSVDEKIYHKFERDPNDLSCYGLGHRGKRKFLVQSNLEAGCRHDLSRVEAKALGTLRSMSVPILERDLPPNSTPYWQDDLPDKARAVKEEFDFKCTTGKEADRQKPPRSFIPVSDNSWSCLTWTPRKVDDSSAAKFVEGQDLIFGVPDEDHTEVELRNAMGKHKRSFGNSHNKSEFRHDYNDDPRRKSEFIAIVHHHLAADVDDDARKTERTIRWGHNHGRRKFVPKDHLGKDVDDGDGVAYFSQNGTKLGKVKHLVAEDHIDRPETDGTTSFFVDAHGTKGIERHRSISRKKYEKVVDHVDELMNCDVQSEDSSMMNVTGIRRKTDVIRPCSARRFPQKDFERTTPRSATPRVRSQSQVGLRLADRPKWSK